MSGGAVAVLVVGAGLPWEPTVLATLDATAGMVLLRRCMDVTDLLAHAAAGDGRVAVLAAEAPGLDADAVARLRRDGVEPLVVVPAGAAGAAAPLSRLGVRHVLQADQLAGLAGSLRAAAADDGSVPSVGPDRAPRSRGGGDPTGAGCVAVWGPTGAPGRTTVALGLASELSDRGADPLLVDADPWGGTVGQRLAILDEVSGLLAAARAASRGGAGADLLAAAALRAGGVRVVTGLPRADRWREVPPEVLEALVGDDASPRIVDTGFSLEDDPAADFAGRAGRNGLTHTALTVADSILVVGSPDPVGLARLARGLDDLRDRSGGQPVHVVLNRWRSRVGIAQQEARRLLEGFADLASFHVLPDDPLAADRSLITGRTLHESGPSPLSRAFAALADELFPEAGPRVATPPSRIRGRRGAGARRR